MSSRSTCHYRFLHHRGSSYAVFANEVKQSIPHLARCLTMDCPGLRPRRDNTLEEQAYFKKIHGQVLKSFSAYVERMDVVSRSIERLDKGISQLREDFDSNTNVVVQMRMFLFSVVMVFWGLVVFLADKGMGVIPYKFTFPVLTGVGVAALGVIFAGYMLVARMYANRSAKVMEATVHTGIERCLINCSQTEQIVEEMVQHYIAGTGPRRKLGTALKYAITAQRKSR